MYTESSFLQKPLLEKFLRLQQIPQRLYLLEEFLLEAKKNPEANIIPSLNEALTLAPQWVSVDFWGEFAKIIIKHKYLYPTLPHLFHFFYLHQHVL